MDNKTDYVGLVKRAQLGDKESLDRLAELGRERLCVYVYRLTLADDVTQDIVQESILEMFKVLGKLKRADRFWPWLRGIAFNKIRRHHRTQRRQRMTSMSEVEHGREQKDGREGLANLVSQELKQIVLTAMHQLKPRHRTVLTMRCYEEMEYSEIAKLMGCSEFVARVLFHRAKKALAKQLSRQGLGKGTLLTALVLFGKMTAPSEAAAAAVSVTAATVKVGAIASLAAMAASKTVIVPLTAAGVLTVGTMVATQGTNEVPIVPQYSRAKSIYATPKVAKTNKGVESYWYFFPDGAAGPVMMRLMKSDSQGTQSYCAYRQNEHANYHFDRGRNTIYIENYRMWNSDLSVYRLPTDKPGLTEFVSSVEGKRQEMGYVAAGGDGLLVIARHNAGVGEGCWAIRHYNVLDEEYFRYEWPAGIKVVDNRDVMHRRGWTYFRVSGEIDGKEVSGSGRIPFVYETSQEYYPWLRLQVAGKKIVNCDGFGGLARPWMGLHTIDTVRRDAAEQEVWFETKYTPGEIKTQVALTRERVKLVYTVDMKKDVIDKIEFSERGAKKGELKFSYLQEIDQIGDEFIEPGASGFGQGQRERSGMLWLVKLAERKKN